jgi:hypothetical protein
MVDALDEAVSDINKKDYCQKAIEPACAGMKVVLKACVIVHLIWKQQRRDKEYQCGIGQDKRIFGVFPLRDRRQPELKPPEVNHEHQQIDDPQKMRWIDRVSPRMLHKPRQARQKTRDTYTGHQADQHTDMKEPLNVAYYTFRSHYQFPPK